MLAALEFIIEFIIYASSSLVQVRVNPKEQGGALMQKLVETRQRQSIMSFGQASSIQGNDLGGSLVTTSVGGRPLDLRPAWVYVKVCCKTKYALYRIHLLLYSFDCDVLFKIEVLILRYAEQ